LTQENQRISCTLFCCLTTLKWYPSYYGPQGNHNLMITASLSVSLSMALAQEKVAVKSN
jgi:hypothetical protein